MFGSDFRKRFSLSLAFSLTSYNVLYGQFSFHFPPSFTLTSEATTRVASLESLKDTIATSPAVLEHPFICHHAGAHTLKPATGCVQMPLIVVAVITASLPPPRRQKGGRAPLLHPPEPSSLPGCLCLCVCVCARALKASKCRLSEKKLV